MQNPVWKYDIILTVPVDHGETARQVAELLGHGPNNFSSDVADKGNLKTITHKLMQASATDDFLAVLAGAGKGQLAPQLQEAVDEKKIAAADIWAMFASLLESTFDNDGIIPNDGKKSGIDQITDYLKPFGLVRVVPETTAI